MSPDRSSVLEADSRLRPKPGASPILGAGKPNLSDNAGQPGDCGEDDGARQALKMEVAGRLSAGIAHDFNNLLTIILGYTEVALDAVRQDDPLFDDRGDPGRRRKGRSPHRRPPSFSRRRSVEQRPVDLGRLVEGMLPMLRRIIGEKIALDSAVEAGHVVLADPSQIEQVVMNLVVNARDAMPAGGRLTIRAQRLSDPPLASNSAGAGWVVLTVEDTGVGMDAATQAQLFEPFFTTKPAGAEPAWACRRSAMSSPAAAATSVWRAPRGGDGLQRVPAADRPGRRRPILRSRDRPPVRWATRSCS